MLPIATSRDSLTVCCFLCQTKKRGDTNAMSFLYLSRTVFAQHDGCCATASRNPIYTRSGSKTAAMIWINAWVCASRCDVLALPFWSGSVRSCHRSWDSQFHARRECARTTDRLFCGSTPILVFLIVAFGSTIPSTCYYNLFAIIN